MDVLILNADGNPLSVMPLSVISWQTAIRLAFVNKVRVMTHHDDWVVRSPTTTMHVPSVVMCTEYVKWPRQVKYNRGNVFLRDDYICQLQSTYRCKKVHGKGYKLSELTIDHVVPRSHGGKTSWTNVTTACRYCNSEKGSDKRVKPIHAPKKPSYYHLVAKRQQLPITIRDIGWLNYLSWDEDLVWYSPVGGKGKHIKLTDHLSKQMENTNDYQENN